MAARKDSSVMVFAHAPVAGRVKKRLIPVLGEHGAAALHRSLVEHALMVANEAAQGPVELWCNPGVDDPFFQSCHERFGVTLHPQCAGDHGLRLLDALEEGLTRARQVVLFASDCPALGAADVRAAIRAMHDGRDAVFSPAEDGGYLLVGLSHVMPALFEAMPWGTDAVMEETRQRLRNLGWRWLELATRWDVERPEDYQRMVREGGFAPTHP